MYRAKFKVTLFFMGLLSLLISHSIYADFGFDSRSKTLLLEPNFIEGDCFYKHWEEDASPADEYIYEHDMMVDTQSWYYPTILNNLRAYEFYTSSSASADVRVLSPSDMLALRCTNYYNANDTSLALDHYFEYSLDDGSSYATYFSHLNWDLGSPAGTGDSTNNKTSQVLLSSPTQCLRNSFAVDQLSGWSEYYGTCMRIWGRSSQTEYHDNYADNPFNREGGTPFWSYSATSWLSANNGILANGNSLYQTDCIYIVAQQCPMDDIDIRLISSDLPSSSEAIFTASSDTKLNIGISTSINGPYTTVYSAGGYITNSANPGVYVDLDSYGNPHTLYVKIFSTLENSATSHYIRWGGFHVEVTPISSGCQYETPQAYWDALECFFETDGIYNTCYSTDSSYVAVSIPPDSSTQVKIYGSVYDAWGNFVQSIPTTYATSSNQYRPAISLPTDLGYYEISITAEDPDDSNNSATIQEEFIIVDQSPTVNTKNLSSAFGVNTHFSHGWPTAIAPLIKRAGIDWIRDGYGSTAVTDVAADNKLCLMSVLGHRSELADWFDDELAVNSNHDRDWDYTSALGTSTDVLDIYRQYAIDYGDVVDAYDLMNEPHGIWGAVLGGSWDGGQWLETFADYAGQLSDVIHEEDPNATVVWEDVDSLIWYEDFEHLTLSNKIDCISPHPYNLSRSVPDPEDQHMMLQQTEWNEFLDDNNLDWQIWTGEVGFTTFDLYEPDPPTYYYNHTELEQAQYIVRMSLMHLAFPIERIFYYDFKDDGNDPCNPEHNFGLVRYDMTPKPALAAYSYLASRYRDATDIHAFDMGDSNVYAYTIEFADNEPTLVIWAKSGTSTVNLTVNSDVTQVAVCNMFGTFESPLSISGHTLSITAEETPVYIDGLKAVDICYDYEYDDSTDTIEIEPDPVDGAVFYSHWKDAGTSADASIYSHDMTVATSSWYGSEWDNLRSYNGVGGTGSEAAAEIKVSSLDGAIVAIRSQNYYDCYDLGQMVDHYYSYSLDGSSYTDFFSRLNWNLGSPAGTGYGVIASDSAQVMINSNSEDIYVSHRLEELPSSCWSELYGMSARIWAKSSKTEYHDNYIDDPFARPVGGPVWTRSTLSWLSTNNGILANNYALNPTECVYIVSYDGKMNSVDIRLTSTDLPDSSEAIWTPSSDTKLNIAVATSVDGTYTTVYSGSGSIANSENPGATVDLSSYGFPEVLYIKIFSSIENDATSYFIRWGGFHVSIEPLPWNYDDTSEAVVVDPGLADGAIFYDYWKIANTNADAHIYSHDMTVATSSWYGSAWHNLRSYNGVGGTGSEASSDIQVVCDTGDIVAVRTINYYNCYDLDQLTDHYYAYSTDGYSFTNYYSRLNWDLGSPAGTGYGNVTSDMAQTLISLPSDMVFLRFNVQQLPDGRWSELYGMTSRIWAKSSETEYHDNYTDDPFSRTLGGPIWTNSTTAWLSGNNGMLGNSYSTNPTECVYIVAHQDSMQSIDIRLGSTDLADSAEAIFTSSSDTKLNIGIATDVSGPYTTVYSGSGFIANSANPGVTVDLSDYDFPDIVFVKIFSSVENSATSHYIRWGGFHVTVVPTIWEQISYDDFEYSWGRYTDGGDDCLRSTSNPSNGSYCVNIQDDSGDSSSFYTTNGKDLDTNGYKQLKIEFSFKAVSMETGEDFWLQYYDGSTWHTIYDYDSGTDFVNGLFYSHSVYIYENDYAFPSNMKIRFQCDASTNYDDVYIDQVRVLAK